MRIVVIGTINNDLILPFEGASIQSLGGIYYVVSALSQLATVETEIMPVSFLGDDLYPAFRELIRQYKNLRADGLVAISQKNHKVILEYKSPEERSEKSLFSFPSLEWKHLEPHANGDFFIVNMVTGWDISIEAFLELSKVAYDRMYLDVHFLTMGRDEVGGRFPRQLDDMEQWLRGARFIQMNKSELSILGGTYTREKDFFQKHLKDDQVLVVTAGNDGARLVFAQHDMLREIHIPGHALEKLVDVTGSGDVFGAGFTYYYLQTKDIVKSAEFANDVAAANCMLQGTNQMEDIINLCQTLRQEGRI